MAAIRHSETWCRSVPLVILPSQLGARIPLSIRTNVFCLTASMPKARQEGAGPHCDDRPRRGGAAVGEILLEHAEVLFL